MRRLVPLLIDWLRLLAGLPVFWATERTPASTFAAMIRLHTSTNGASSALMQAALRPLRRSQPIGLLRAADDVFGALATAELQATIERLRVDGFAILPQRVPPATIERLRRFAETTPGEAWDAAGNVTPLRVYDRADTRVAKLQLYTRDLVNQPDIQDLAGDPALVGIVQAYLGCAPLLDTINMWWSTPHSERPSDEIAQTFHFDLDRLRWLKVFIYLTDVDQHRGPHVFVRGSHRRDGRDAQLVSRGYVRIADEEIVARHGAERLVEICGFAGTVLIEDTSGFHKGVLPGAGDRLMLELQFSCAGFGANYERMRVTGTPTPRFARSRQALPRVYEAFE